MKHVPSHWRRALFAVRFAVLATVGLTGLAQADPPPRPPNVVLVMADDLGPEWIGCYGAEDVETPEIDALATGGMRFTCAYSMPLCTPTRVTLLTGQYPFRHGWINHWDVPRWGAGCHFDPGCYMTFAQIMKRAGYATAAAGKWQINDFRVQPNVMRAHGFDQWCMWTGVEAGNPPSRNRYWNPYVHTPEGSRICSGQFGADVFVDFLIDFMERHRSEPMLLYYAMVLPHVPFTTTPRDRDVETVIDKYRAMVRYVDYALGRLVGALDTLEIRDNTIVVFTADNGSGRRLQGRMNGRVVAGGKGMLTENGCREPFIVNCPGLVPAGVVTDALTDFSDLLPSLVELVGAELPDGVTIDGHSLAKVIRGERDDSERTWIMAMGGGVARVVDGRVEPVEDYAPRVVRDKRYKLWIEAGRGTKLFDLDQDPEEKHNLVDRCDPATVAARKKLEAAARQFPEKDASPQYHPTPPQPGDEKRQQPFTAWGCAGPMNAGYEKASSPKCHLPTKTVL